MPSSLEATLSFLGIGLPITEPSLGLLIAHGYEYLLSGKYWISFFPGLALLATIVSINLVGDQPARYPEPAAPEIGAAWPTRSLSRICAPSFRPSAGVLKAVDGVSFSVGKAGKILGLVGK